MDSSIARLDNIYARLWDDFVDFNPQAKKIYDLLLAREKAQNPNLRKLNNDHIALRTFDMPAIGLDKLARHFVALGYSPKGEYQFEEKKLFARHFEHEDPSQPKVFISELLTAKFSPFLQEVVLSLTSAIPSNLVADEKLLWSRRGWKAEFGTYKRLLEESEYAAWVYAFGYRANHFTISFNELKTFGSLSDLNLFIQSQGIALNESGGLIKGNPSEYLEQSSTRAGEAPVDFAEGTQMIPACYYEFARRYPLANGQLYQGFVAKSADKIFESTDVKHR